MYKLNGFKYLTFGLREEWVENFVRNGEAFFLDNSLGPRQLDAFIYYLKDTGLIDRKKKPTSLFEDIKELYGLVGIKDMFLWSVLWANLCINAPLFRWWTDVPPGIYTRDLLIEMMSESYGKMNKSVINGYLSLVGTFERTEIGKALRQGTVVKDGNSRKVIKEENPNISPFSILYLLYKLGEIHQTYSFNLSDLDKYFVSPCKVFTVRDSILESRLNSLWLPDIFEFDKGQISTINLNKEKGPLDILDLYIGRLS